MKHAGGGSGRATTGTQRSMPSTRSSWRQVDQLRRGRSGAAGHAGGSSGQHRRNAGWTLADAGFRSEAVLAKVADHHGDVTSLPSAARDVKMPRSMPKTHPHTAAIAAKLKTEQGDAAYRRRKSIVEARSGWIKAVMGLRQFSMRGLDKVQAGGSSSAWR